MKDYDYHRPAEKVLLDSYRKQNRNKNRLLFLAVALTVGVIFCMISFAYGKIQVDIQKHIRTDGMTVSTYLENGTEEMAGQLHTLSYIAETGKEKFAGKLCDQTIKYCDCVVADETAFETMLCPAYTQIIGTYPKQENEIMLSTKTLTYLGISEPKVGMELKLDFYWNDLFQTKGTGQQTFQLSGYFTEYQNQGASSSIAFLSEKKLKESGAGWNPCRILLKPEKDSVSGIQMEQQLQEDIRLKEGQRIGCMDSAAYRAVEGMLGSYGFAALFSFLILLCMFLFIYNILNLSLGKDLQQYGLMEVIGVQQHQIIQVMFRQMMEVVLKGSFAGVAIGSLVVLGILPSVIGKLYLGQAEELEGISFYQPGFFLIAILPVAVTLGVVILLVKQKIKVLSPLECMNYGTGTVAEKKQTKKRKAVFQSFGNKPEVYLARRYLFYNKKAFFITMISLTIGCGLALGSSVIVKGVDLQNQFIKEPNFQIRITQEACRTLMETSPDTENMVFFPKEFLENIKQTAGNSLQDETKIQGFYPIIGKQGRDSIKLLNDGETVPTVIQKISSSEKEKLQEFLKEQEITTDWKTFAHENGTILLHDHRVSEYSEERALEQLGNTIEVYDLVPVGTDMSDRLSETLINCGYLDITKEGFPELELCWDGRNTNLLLVTEETFETLSENLTPQTFEMSFSVEKEQESGCKNRLKGMIQTENMEFQSENGYAEQLNLFQMESRSDLLLKEQEYIQTSRRLLLVISGCLIFIGIMNLLNVRVTDMLLRKKECAIMNRVGMTRKQLQRMFLAEGMFTWLLLSALLVTTGTLLIGGIGWYMKTKISYFVFYYPLKEMAGMLLLLLAVSLVTPGILYRRVLAKNK